MKPLSNARLKRRVSRSDVAHRRDRLLSERYEAAIAALFELGMPPITQDDVNQDLRMLATLYAACPEELRPSYAAMGRFLKVSPDRFAKMVNYDKIQDTAAAIGLAAWGAMILIAVRTALAVEVKRALQGKKGSMERILDIAVRLGFDAGMFMSDSTLGPKGIDLRRPQELVMEDEAAAAMLAEAYEVFCLSESEVEARQHDSKTMASVCLPKDLDAKEWKERLAEALTNDNG